MFVVARSVILERRAQDALDSALRRWKRAELAWDAINWVLSHDPEAGPLLAEGHALRGFTYPGARSIDEPDVDVLYDDTVLAVTVHNLTFRDARSPNVGFG